MTEDEVIEALEMMIGYADWEYPLDYSIALDEAIKAIKLRTPKKPEGLTHFKNAAETYGANMVMSRGACPTCGKKILRDHPSIWYCPMCGQALDWGEEDETD